MTTDDIERKRLKKKMLDRWENEGGSIAADPVIANQSNLASRGDGEGTQASVSNNSSRVENTEFAQRNSEARLFVQSPS